MMEELVMRMDSKIRIPLGEIPVGLRRTVERVLMFRNPQYDKEKRFSKGAEPKVPRLLSAFYEMDDHLCINRGAGPALVRMCQEMRIPFRVKDETCWGEEQEIVFCGDLIGPGRAAALSALVRRRMGVLAGLPGSGKRQVALAWIGERRRRTLIIVKTRAQLYAWQDAVKKWLKHSDEDFVGLVGDGHADLEKPVTIGIDRSLYHHTTKFLYRTGAVILDRADRANFKLLRKLVGSIPAAYVLGLAEHVGDSLWNYKSTFVGPVLFRLERVMVEKQGLGVKVINVECGTGRNAECGTRNAEYDAEKRGAYAKLVSGLVRDDGRNRRILADVHAETSQTARRAVIVSERVAHLRTLQDGLVQRDSGLVCSKTTDDMLDDIHRRYHHGKLQVILVAAKSAERLDLRRGDRLFVVSPISDGGAVAKLTGMVRDAGARNGGGEVWDYRDNVNVLKAGANRRMKIYKQMGGKVMRNAKCGTRNAEGRSGC